MILIYDLCTFVSTHRPHIALWVMLYGIGTCVYNYHKTPCINTLMFDDVSMLPPPNHSLAHALYLVGFTQLSTYMAVDTIGNWLSPNPRLEIYVHHGVCGAGLLTSFMYGMTWPPLTTFGMLEIITVCRFVDDTKYERFFCWMRILCTIFVRLPVSLFGSYWGLYVYPITKSYDTNHPIVRLYMVWGLICLAVVPFDCYLMTFYVKRLRRSKKKIV
jgi:hypothetical protein